MRVTYVEQVVKVSGRGTRCDNDEVCSGAGGEGRNDESGCELHCGGGDV